MSGESAEEDILFRGQVVVRGGEAVNLTAEGGNPPYVAEGYSVSGNGEAVRITAPGKNNLSCHN